MSGAVMGSEEKGKTEFVYRVTIDIRIYMGEHDMPSEWIQKKAEQEKKEEEKWRAREEKEKRDAELIRSLGPSLLDELRKVIDNDIVAWNQNFGDRQINNTESIHAGFKVCKPKFPFGMAEITFNPTTLRIDVKLTRSTAVDASRTYESDGYFNLIVNPDGRDIHLEDRRNTHLLAPGFSRVILEIIAEPNSHHMI